MPQPAVNPFFRSPPAPASLGFLQCLGCILRHKTSIQLGEVPAPINPAVTITASGAACYECIAVEVAPDSSDSPPHIHR